MAHGDVQDGKRYLKCIPGEGALAERLASDLAAEQWQVKVPCYASSGCTQAVCAPHAA